jgi:hypothetical protein
VNKRVIITLLAVVLLIGNLFGLDPVGDAELHLAVNVKEFFLHGFFEGEFNVQPSGLGEYLLQFEDEQYWLGLGETEDFSLSRDANVSLEDGIDNYSKVATYHIATNTQTTFSINFAISNFTTTGGVSIPWTLVVNSANLTNLTLNGTTPINLASGTTHSGILTRPQAGLSVGYLLFNVTFGDDGSLATAGSYDATVTASVVIN